MTASAGKPDVLEQLGQLAADLGLALAPPGHDELLRSVVSTAARAFRAQACSLAVLDQAAEELVFAAAWGGSQDEILGMTIPVGHGIAGWAVASGQPILVDDVSRDPRFARDFSDALGYTPTSIVALPLETERDVFGVLELLDPAQGFRDMELMTAYAHQAALIVEALRHSRTSLVPFSGPQRGQLNPTPTWWLPSRSWPGALHRPRRNWPRWGRTWAN